MRKAKDEPVLMKMTEELLSLSTSKWLQLGEKQKRCVLLYIIPKLYLCYLHYITLSVLFYDYIHVDTQIPIQIHVCEQMISRIHQVIKPARFVSAKHTLPQEGQITEAGVVFENLLFAPLHFLIKRDQMCLCILVNVQPLRSPSFNFVGFGTTAGYSALSLSL